MIPVGGMVLVLRGIVLGDGPRGYSPGGWLGGYSPGGWLGGKHWGRALPCVDRMTHTCENYISGGNN